MPAQLTAAEINDLRAGAAAWSAHQAAETARIDGLKAALLPHQQAALDAAPTLDGKRTVLAMIAADKAATDAKPVNPPLGSPGAPAPAGAVVDIAKLVAAGTTVETLKKNHLAEYEAYLDSFSSSRARSGASRFLHVVKKPA